MRFSDRTAWELGEGALARAVRERRAAGLDLIDLTVANPTVCGFAYDAHALLEPLLASAAMVYDPDPRGLRSAREAVAGYYAEHAAEVDPDAILLTTSTSEAYSFLFRLLADAGDEVLIAQPGYPLFDFLGRLDDVVLQAFPLFYDFGWWIDFSELERRITSRTRAIVLVSPNNPTGHCTRRPERERLEEICARHGLALIVDEVFLDYGLVAPGSESFATGPHPCLTFVVSGLSKCAALPQMKVGWLAAFGPEPLRTEALKRLEVIADTFLSLNAPAQHALPTWLAGRHGIAEQIRQRVRASLRTLEASGIRLLPVEAGWSAVLKMPAQPLTHSSQGDLAEALVREAGVLTHPAGFYAMPGAGRLVVSLIGPIAGMETAIEKFKAWFEPDQLTPQGWHSS